MQQREPDVGDVAALARLQLEARRLGAELVWRDPDHRLLELVELLGLSDLLPASPASVELEGQPEQREQPLDVEEVGGAVDPLTAQLDDDE
ncbi:hypothetical protein [Angustibacter aerolatus]